MPEGQEKPPWGAVRPRHLKDAISTGAVGAAEKSLERVLPIARVIIFAQNTTFTMTIMRRSFGLQPQDDSVPTERALRAGLDGHRPYCALRPMA